MTNVLARNRMLSIECAYNKKHEIPTTVLEGGLVLTCPICKKKSEIYNWGGGFKTIKIGDKK